jgi:hypothetical protein
MKPVNSIFSLTIPRIQLLNFWHQNDDDDGSSGGNDEIIPFSDFALNSIGISGRR